jgi:hypothetical protein
MEEINACLASYQRKLLTLVLQTTALMHVQMASISPSATTHHVLIVRQIFQIVKFAMMEAKTSARPAKVVTK